MMVVNQKNAEVRRNSNEMKALEESRNKLTNELDRLRTHLVEVNNMSKTQDTPISRNNATTLNKNKNIYLLDKSIT